MITFTFANGGVATIRTSGTEPKIKYYTELCAAPGNRFWTASLFHTITIGLILKIIIIDICRIIIIIYCKDIIAEVILL